VTGEDCIMRSLIIFTLNQTVIGRSNQGGSDRPRVVEKRNAYRNLVGKHKGMRLFGRTVCR
jgi:hypothetical protein